MARQVPVLLSVGDDPVVPALPRLLSCSPRGPPCPPWQGTRPTGPSAGPSLQAGHQSRPRRSQWASPEDRAQQSLAGGRRPRGIGRVPFTLVAQFGISCKPANRGSPPSPTSWHPVRCVWGHRGPFLLPGGQGPGVPGTSPRSGADSRCLGLIHQQGGDGAVALPDRWRSDD